MTASIGGNYARFGIYAAIRNAAGQIIDFVELVGVADLLEEAIDSISPAATSIG
jgi:hypothetical protein